mmetsp:Transcript_18124/g.32220  ORF Transcript_18124/g.32220 Transcript_18124/m.32220 type:complete len:1001 (-) Transcript_18124:44-3046(-)
MGKLHKEVEDTMQQSVRTREDLVNIKQVMELVQRDINSLKATHAQHDEIVQALQFKVKDTGVLKVDVQQLQDDYHTLARDINNTKQSTIHLQEEAATIVKTSSGLKATLLEIENKLQVVQSAASSDVVDKMQLTLEETQTALLKCERRFSETQSQVQELQGDQRSLQASQRDLRQEIVVVEEATSIAKRELMACKVHVDNAMAESSTGVQRLSKRMEGLEEQVTVEVGQLRSICDGGTHALKDLKQELSDSMDKSQRQTGQDMARLTDTCEALGLSLDKLCEAHRGTAGAAAEASDKLDRRLGKLEGLVNKLDASFAQHCEETEAGVRNTTEHFQEQDRQVQEVQHLLQLKLRACEADFAQKVTGAEMAVTQCRQEMQKREEALVKSFEVMQAPLRVSLTQTSERLQSLLQSLEAMSVRIDEQQHHHQQLERQLEERAQEVARLSAQQDEQQGRLQEELQQQQGLQHAAQVQLQQQQELQQQLQQQEMKQQLQLQLQQLQTHLEQRMSPRPLSQEGANSDAERQGQLPTPFDAKKLAELEHRVQDVAQRLREGEKLTSQVLELTDRVGAVEGLADRVGAVEENLLEVATQQPAAPPSPVLKDRLLSPVRNAEREMKGMALRLEREVAELQQEVQGAMTQLKSLSQDMGRCLEGRKELDTVQERLGYLQEQADNVLNWQLKRLTADVAGLKRDVHSLSTAADPTALVQEMAQLTEIVHNLCRQDTYNPSEDESMGSLYSEQTSTETGTEMDTEGTADDCEAVTAPAGQLSSQNPALVPAQHPTPEIPLSASAADRAATIMASYESIMQGIEKLKVQTNLAKPAALLAAEDPVAPFPDTDTDSTALIENLEADVHALRAEIQTQNLRLGNPEPSGPVPTSAFGHVRWAEPLCETDPSVPAFADEQDSSESIADISRQLSSLRTVLAQTQGHANTSLDDACETAPSPILSTNSSLDFTAPLPSDGESSSDGMGTSDHLIASVQTNLSSLAGMLAQTYGKISHQ